MSAEAFFSTYDADFFDLLMQLEDEPLHSALPTLPDDHIIHPTTAAEVKLGSTKVPASQQVIGFGHNIKPHEVEQFAKGATVKNILRTMVFDVADADREARRIYDSAYGEGSFSSLGKLQKQLLTEKVFNVGAAGTKKFKGLLQAVYEGDFDAMKQHVRVGSYVTKGGKRTFRPDVRRTSRLQSYIDSQRDPLAVAAIATAEGAGQ